MMIIIDDRIRGAWAFDEKGLVGSNPSVGPRWLSDLTNRRQARHAVGNLALED